jgi:putative aldouronate transport system substrate-binding protein
MKPDGQASEFYDGLQQDVKDTFDAYGVKTYVEMIGTCEAPGPWYPMWSFSGSLTTATPGGTAWTKMGECKHQYLPKVVMSDNFEDGWNEYMKAYNACNPQDFLSESQTELEKRVADAAKYSN